MTQIIPLTKNRYAVVDDEFWLPLITMGRWQYCGKYARRDGYRGQPVVQMHRLILEHIGHDLTGLEVDHKNGDKLDNRLSNLRPATASQNAANRHELPTNTSGFRGVVFHKRSGKWQAQISVSGHYQYLGCFKSAEDAAHAYDRAAIQYHGDFANLNFPLPEMAAA